MRNSDTYPRPECCSSKWRDRNPGPEAAIHKIALIYLFKDAPNPKLPDLKAANTKVSKMDILLRESLFGRILNSVTNNAALPYPQHVVDKSHETQTTTDSPEDGPHLSPRHWPAVTKGFATVGVMLLNFSFYAAAAIFTPSIPLIEQDLGASTSQGTLGLSLFVIAYGIGPLVVSDGCVSFACNVTDALGSYLPYPTWHLLDARPSTC